MASSSFHTQLQQGDEGIEISGTAILGMLRGGICVVCSDGRTKYTLYKDVATATGGTERKHDPQSDNREQLQKFHYITPTVFVAFAGSVPDGECVIDQVKNQLEMIPHESMDEIAATFVRWSNRMVSTREGERNEYLVFGRMREEDQLEMIEIFFSDNSVPEFRAANASNALSIKVCSVVPQAGYYAAHRRAMCALGSGNKDVLSYLENVGHIENNEEQMREVAKMAVANACKDTGLCGGNIFMVTLSGHNAPRFHTAPVMRRRRGNEGRILYGEIKEGGFKPEGYDEA